MAIAGLGCALRSQWDVAPFVKRGELKRILAGWDFEGADVLALVPARQGISARVARFVGIEFVRGALRVSGLAALARDLALLAAIHRREATIAASTPIP